MKKLTYPAKDENPEMNEVRGVWNLPNRAPFTLMTISCCAVHAIDPHCLMMGPSVALEALWRDFETSSQKACHDVHTALKVTSYVGDFCVVEHLCGRVAIYLPDEVPKPFQVPQSSLQTKKNN